MKKSLCFLAFIISQFVFSQEYGVGIHYQMNSSEEHKSIFVVNFDMYNYDGFVYGIDIGFSEFGVPEDQDYSGNVNLGQFTEDITGEYINNVIKFGGRFGRNFKGILVVGSAGLNFFSEYQIRYDNLHILGDNGSYGIKTGNNPVRGYYKLSLAFQTIGTIIPEIGYGNDGVSIGFNIKI